MTTRWILGLGYLVVLAGPVLAREAPQWSVDAAKSRLGFTGQQTGQAFSGRFKTWTADIAFDPAHPEAAEILATVAVASATTDDPQKDEALPGADWFDAAAFPSARYEAKGFERTGADTYVAHGTLTLRGVTKPLDLPFTLTVAGDRAHAVGHATILRTTFGVGQGSWAAGDMVALEVGIDLDIEATKAP